MRRRPLSAVLLLPPLLLVAAPPAQAGDQGFPATITLSGDPEGSQFEGIDIGCDGSTFYVTEVTGGEVHRGRVGDDAAEVWLDEDDALAVGRRTAVGIATDSHGRVYVAGGGNRSQEGAPADAPDFWVHDEDGDLLAALRMPVEGTVFLNDVAIGPDGAAYVTDSTSPRIFRIAREDGDWSATVWADPDAPGAPEQGEGFGLNGIELAPDGRSLVAVKSNTGELWRYDLATAEPALVDTGGADLTAGDGMVVKGRTLVVVRGGLHLLSYLRLDRDAESARLLTEVATDPERLLTTADVTGRTLLAVDSQFDEEPPSQDSEVVALPFRP